MQKLGWPTGGLKDYQPTLPTRVLAPDGRAGQDTATGPLVSPVSVPEEATSPLAILQSLERMLGGLPFAIGMEFRRQLMLPSRDAVWFNQSQDLVTVGPGLSVAVVTQPIDERQVGVLEKVGVFCQPSASISDLRWSILLNNIIHPKFGQRQFAANTYTTPWDFRMEIMQTQSLVLQVTNTGAAAVEATGVLIGWQEPLSELKPYGDSPQSGIG